MPDFVTWVNSGALARLRLRLSNARWRDKAGQELGCTYHMDCSQNFTHAVLFYDLRVPCIGTDVKGVLSRKQIASIMFSRALTQQPDIYSTRLFLDIF